VEGSDETGGKSPVCNEQRKGLGSAHQLQKQNLMKVTGGGRGTAAYKRRVAFHGASFGAKGLMFEGVTGEGR